MHRSPGRIVALAAVALLGLSTLAVTTATATDRATTDRTGLRATTVPSTLGANPADRFRARPIQWGPCDPDDFLTLASDGSSLVPPSYQCAEYQVPLDYDRPRREKITLSLIKRPADNPGPARRTFFVNPGGPGGSGVQAVAYGGEGLAGPEVLAEFDIIGLDPRGIAGSTPLQCYADNAELIEDLTANELRVPWPVTSAEFAAARRDARDFASDCSDANPIINHMSTTNVARDISVLSRAVRSDRIDFVGFSYGTYVCAQLIAQFPGRTGALICDANLDPVEWATGDPVGQGNTVPLTARVGSEVGGNAIIEEFFRLCDAGGPEACAFAPDSRNRFYALYGRLAASPIDIDGFSFDERNLVASANGPLYDSLFGFAFLAQFFAEIEARVAGTVVEPVEQVSPIVDPVNEQYLNFEGFSGVTCGETLQPDNFRDYRRALENSQGLFGPVWASGNFECERWPGQDTDAYYGPFDQTTTNPVLIINNRFDPATPYDNAVKFNNRLGNSSLLTNEGWGHVAYFSSTCVREITDSYLLTRTLPGAELTCSQDIVPFSPEAVALLNPGVSPEPTAPEPTAPEEPAAPLVAEAASNQILDAAVDAALGELADSGDPAEATAEATQIIIEALDAAGDTELADQLRSSEAIRYQARTSVG